MGLLDGRSLWFNRDHLFHDCCDHDLPKIFTSPTHCDLSNITYILLYSGSFQKKNIKNKSAFRLWPRHRSLPIHSGNFFWLDFEKISWVKEVFFRKLYYRVKPRTTRILDGRNSQKYLHQTWTDFLTLIMSHKLTQYL